MSGESRRRIAALVVPCALAMACDCGDTALLRPPQKDVTVQVHGGVSCRGERVQLRAIVYGGKPPFHFRWEPAEGLDDPTSDAPTAEPGTGRDYTVTVIDSQSVELTGRATVVRGAPPVPVLSFTKGAENTCAGETVALDASRTVDQHGLAMKSYVWKVGGTLLHEGPDATSGDFVPRHGDVVSLTVRDSTGCEETVEKTLAVRALPRVEVDFAEGGPFVCAGTEARLEALATNADGNPVESAQWDLDGDPNTFEATGTSSGRFTPNGSRALFVARDGAGCTTSVETPIEVGPLPRPALRFAQGAAEVCEGGRITLDAGASTDALGSPVSAFAWDLDGVPATVESTDAQPPQLVAVGDRDVRLTVTDARGCKADLTQHVRGRPLPLADIAFVAGRENVCRGDAVQVSAAGSRDANGQPVATMEWDLNLDGSVDTREATPPAWTPTGSQLLRLTVKDNLGCVSTATQPVAPRALPTPRVSFTSGSPSICDGDEIVLDGSASTDADGHAPLVFSWDFDGDLATDEATGASTGAFRPTAAPVTLEVVDALGCRAATQQHVALKPRPVADVAFVRGAERLCAGDTVQLDASQSHDGQGLPVARLEWDLDGDPATVESTAWKTAAWAPVGTQPVALTVWGANGCTDRRALELRSRTLPTARLAFVEGRADACLGDAIALTAADSTDAEGNPLEQFEWDIAAAPGLDPSLATTPEFAPTTSQLARVTVRDAEGCAATATQQLSPRALPTARVRFTTGSAELCDGQQVALDASESRDADGAQPVSYAWDLDGRPSTVEAFAAATGTWRPDGAPARLTIVDRFGCQASTTQDIDVGGLPVARITQVEGSARVCAGERVAFDAAASTTASGAPIARYEWDYDGTPGADATSARTPTFTPAGTQQVRLTVFDARGCGNTTTTAATALPLPRARISFVDGGPRICAGASVALSAGGSTTDAGQPVSRVAWTLQEGAATTTSTALAPAPFEPAAPVNATLRVWDANDCSAEVSQAIAPRALPNLNVTFVQGRADACLGDAVSLTAEASRDADGNALAGYAWDLDGDGANDTLLGMTPPVPLNSARTVRVRGVDAEGCTSERTLALSPRALPTPDVAFVSGAAALCVGDAVELTAAGSRDADGRPVASYQWSVNGSPRTTAATGSFAPTGTPATLTVVDAQGCRASATQAFDVGALPTARIDFAQGAALVCAGQQVALDGSGSRNAAGGTIARYEWDLDGNAATVESTAAAPAALTPNGARTARLTVFDARGCKASASQAFASRNLPSARIAFTEGRQNACRGDTVRLSAADSRDADGNTVSAFTWDLNGDGTNDATGESPAAFVPQGSASARLVVTDRLGCTAPAVVPLAPRALPTPAIAFVAGGATLCAGDAVELTAAGSRDTDGQPVASYLWNIDGSTRTTAATGSFAPTGTSAALTVVDAQGCRASASQSFDVGALPTARIDFTQGGALVCAGQQVALDGSGSRNAAGGTIARYEWDLDGNAATVESTAAAPGALTPNGTGGARLTVFDARGCKASATRTFASRALPTARITYDQGRRNVCIGDAVRLSAATSSSVDGTALSLFVWDLDDNGTTDATGASSGTFTPTSARTARLTITDAQGCTGTVTESLAPRALPRAVIHYAAGGATVCAGGSVQLDGLASLDADGVRPAQFAWDLDTNGTVDENTVTTAAWTPTRSATASLKVTDALGCSGTATAPVNLRALPTPRITFATGSALVCAGTQVGLDGATSTTADGTAPAAYTWDLDGNGTFEASGVRPAAFALAANRTAKLRVSDALGCAAEATQALSTRTPPTARITFTEGSALVCSGASVRVSGATSQDAGGVLPATFAWDLDNNGTVDATGVSPASFAPASARTVGLRVVDTFGCDGRATTPLTVRALPSMTVDFARGDGAVCGGETVALEAITRDADGNVATVRWDLDGNGTNDATGVRSPDFSPTTNPVRVTAEDAYSCRATSTVPFSIRAPPTARFSLSGASFVCDGEPAVLDARASRDADGNPVQSYAWDIATPMGPFRPTTSVTPSFIPDGPAAISVTDATGCAGTTTGTVPVGSPRYVVASGTTTGGTARPLDIVFVIDNSGSMTQEIEAVQNSINVNFASIIAASGVDYRIILVSKYGRATYDQSICIKSPLGGDNCASGSTRPVLGPRFFHYDTEVGSHNSLNVLLDKYSAPDPHGFAPNGWSGWLRPGSSVAIVDITDDETYLSASSFLSQFVAKNPSLWGTTAAPTFSFQSIVGLKENTPTTAPWEPADPLQNTECVGDMMAPGLEYQRLSKTTGGLRFPLCRLSEFDQFFQRLAQSVIGTARPACDLALPATMTADSSTLVVEYAASSGSGIDVFERVASASACQAGAFYLDGTTARLCPQACDVVKADVGGKVDLTGCNAP